MSNIFEYTFEFDSDWMLSTNDMYIHRPKKLNNNRWSVYTTKSSGLRDFQSMMEEKLKVLITNECIEVLKISLENKRYGLCINTVCQMPIHNYEDSDVSNYIKAYEDCISTRLKGDTKKTHILDDKNNLEYHSIKEFIGEGINHWHIKTTISVIERDEKYINYLINKGEINHDS